MNIPLWYYKRLEKSGHIPWLILKLYPGTHFCLEMDEMLITPDIAHACFCGEMPGAEEARSEMPLEDVPW